MGKILQRISPIIFFEFLDKSGNKERNFLREFIFYTIFCGVSAMVILGTQTSYWFVKLMSDEIIEPEIVLPNNDTKDIFDISDQAEVWHTIETVLSNSFIWDYWYKRPLNPMVGKPFYDSYLLGLPRIRQVRVGIDSCTVQPIFRDEFKHCYGYYSTSTMSTDAFGMGNGTAWTHSELDGPSYEGLVGHYESGGYYQLLSFARIETLDHLLNLRHNKWIDRRTRAVFVELNVYNANINTFNTIKVAFELPPWGGVIVTSNVRSGKLYGLLNWYDFLILAMRIIHVVYIMYFTVNVYYGIKVLKWKFFRDKWNIAELAIAVLGIVRQILRFVIYILASIAVDQLQPKDTVYVDFETLGDVFKHYKNMSGVLLFVTLIRLFKFISRYGTLGQLSLTLQTCVFSIIGFAVTFFIFFAFYAVLAYILFGYKMRQFSTVAQGMFTLVKSIMEMFPNYELMFADFYGLFFFLTYTFLMFFLLINMFLAIINESYTAVKSQLRTARMTREDINFYKRGFGRIFFCKPFKKCFLIEGDDAEKINIIKVLRQAKYTEVEIEMFFQKYDIGKKKDISPKEADDFVAEVLKNNYGMPEAADYIRNHTDFYDVITPEQFLKENIQLQALERNLKKLQNLINQLDHRKARKVKTKNSKSV